MNVACSPLVAPWWPPGGPLQHVRHLFLPYATQAAQLPPYPSSTCFYFCCRGHSFQILQQPCAGLKDPPKRSWLLQQNSPSWCHRWHMLGEHVPLSACNLVSCSSTSVTHCLQSAFCSGCYACICCAGWRLQPRTGRLSDTPPCATSGRGQPGWEQWLLPAVQLALQSTPSSWFTCATSQTGRQPRLLPLCRVTRQHMC